jgi:hypothetical protein
MVKAPDKLALQGIQGTAQVGQRAHHGFGQCLRTQCRQTLAQPPDQREQLAHIGRALPFRTLAQARIGALLIARAQALDEQARVANHSLARGARAALVMLEPGMKFPTGQGR